MHAIVAVDENWGIGCENRLLFTIPEDMKYFKDFTLNKIVVMGNVTFFSLPNSKPLPNRTNIVLSKDANLKIEGAIVCNSVEQLLEVIKDYDPDDVIIIGGQMIYELMLPYCKTALVTKVKSLKKADKFFPNLDLKENWRVKSISEEKNHHDLKYAFYIYENKDRV